MPSAYLTTAGVAERFDVDQGQVLTWIRGGHLAAVDVGAPGNRRPTYRVSTQALAEFEKSRKAIPMPRREVRMRRRKVSNIREYF